MRRKPDDATLALDRTYLDTARLLRTRASLVILQGAEIGRDFRLRRTGMVIGRSPGADIRIPDDLVSREHARVEFGWNSGGQRPSFVIQDLKSTNRTFVNSNPVERAELQDGDRIQIGETVLKFVLLDEVEAKYHEEVRNRISYDQLTGLLTRESLFLALDMEMKRCLRYRLPLSVLMMDLDRFKSVNDTHGHLVGSQVLSGVGRVIRESIRTVDVSARYGGEEFLSYVAETTTAAALEVAERIRRAVESHVFSVDGRTVRLTISIGIAGCPEHGKNVKTLVGRADRALYQAKGGGRNRVCVAGKDRRRPGRKAPIGLKPPRPKRRSRGPRGGDRSSSRPRRSG
jgi:diguanylate cyclase (GGDEF)-like protein